MYRIRDKKKNKWIQKGIYLSPNNDLFISKSMIFGIEKLSLVSEHRYTYQNFIGLNDKNDTMIFEGDICRSIDSDITGLIAYIPEIAAYCLLDCEKSTYYTLSSERCKELKVIGNIFDNGDLISEFRGDKIE